MARAAETGKPVIAVYIHETDRQRIMGSASKWWLHHSLKALEQDLGDLNIPLILYQDVAAKGLNALISASGSDHLVWNRCYEAESIARDTALKEKMTEKGIKAESFNGSLLNEPWEIKSGNGTYYKVFTPYWKAVLRGPPPHEPLRPPRKQATIDKDFRNLHLNDLNLLPSNPDWGAKMYPFWQPGTKGAKQALEEFLDGPITSYGTDRDRPDRDGTSRLSPHLAFGEISPRQIWHKTREKTDHGEKFLSEIGWREFSYALLFHNPELATENFKPDFDGFDWSPDDGKLTRWQKGLTGYPFVDAGMRQLWATGWQHNRVRMVTASFLIKHLLIDWREGETWFWDTLVDADPASNAASWQWVAGSGADASPYFRIFNPITQGQKFDPNGDYVRKWIPELKRLPNKYIHNPWDAPEPILKEAGVTLGDVYPRPVVEHKRAREKALERYKAMKS